MNYMNDLMNDFWDKQAKWSQETFGDDRIRGPIGPLKHLRKESQEALDALEVLKNAPFNIDNLDKLRMEIVDCLFLVFDAARRSGMNYNGLYQHAMTKLDINKQRKWKPNTIDEPTEHVRMTQYQGTFHILECALNNGGTHCDCTEPTQNV